MTDCMVLEHDQVLKEQSATQTTKSLYDSLIQLNIKQTNRLISGYRSIN